MKLLVFDIETVIHAELLSDEMCEYLRKRSKETSEEKIERDIALNPYVLQIASLAMQVIENDQVIESKVIYLETDQAKASGQYEKDIEFGGIRHSVSFIPVLTGAGASVDDSTLVKAFWEHAADVDKLVTFNGAGFDVPALQARTMVLGLESPKVFFEIGKFRNNPDPYWHIDLCDLVSFGEFRHRYSLDFLCSRFGIESPKGDIDGSKVSEAFRQGEHARIAEYNMKDVFATAAFYQKVKPFLKVNNVASGGSSRPAGSNDTITDPQKNKICAMIQRDIPSRDVLPMRLSRLSKTEASALISALIKLSEQ